MIFTRNKIALGMAKKVSDIKKQVFEIFDQVKDLIKSLIFKFGDMNPVTLKNYLREALKDNFTIGGL